MIECVFCHKEKLITDIVYEDELFMAFMDMEPINEGHILVVPKMHYLDVDETPDEVLSHLMLISKKIVVVLKEIYKPDDIALCKMVESLMMLDTIICIFFQDIKGMVLGGHMEVRIKK